MPDDLGRQVEPIHEALDALGWPVIEIEGIEADDVIATLARQASEAGLRTIVSTGDKDLAQLVNERVTLVNTMSNETLDAAGVNAKFGVPPERIVDYLTLVGDSIDNVPGVDKVGPKTAAKWIEKYGSLEGVLAHAGEITGLAGENLRQVADWLPKARELLTIRTDVALPARFDALQGKPDPAAQRALYERFGFKTWLREVQDAPAGAPAEAPPAVQKRRTRTILAEDGLRDLLLKLQAVELAGFNAVCAGDEPMTARLVGLAFAFADEAVYVPLAHEYPAAPSQIGVETALSLLRPWLEDDARLKVGENVKFDTHALANQGVRLAGCAHDTML
jgi:DNA polymerase-1